MAKFETKLRVTKLHTNTKLSKLCGFKVFKFKGTPGMLKSRWNKIKRRAEASSDIMDSLESIPWRSPGKVSNPSTVHTGQKHSMCSSTTVLACFATLSFFCVVIQVQAVPQNAITIRNGFEKPLVQFQLRFEGHKFREPKVKDIAVGTENNFLFFES